MCRVSQPVPAELAAELKSLCVPGISEVVAGSREGPEVLQGEAPVGGELEGSGYNCRLSCASL